jgi:Fe-S-cluster containining protein
MRSEFGFTRIKCSCHACQKNCRFMPGFLIPSDLGRMIPAGADPGRWAEENLLASPGALVIKDERAFRIRTLVPAVKPDGSCRFLSSERRCTIHEIAPFGCAFFDCRPERGHLSEYGLKEVARAWAEGGLYSALWLRLWESGQRQQSPDALRRKMTGRGVGKEFMKINIELGALGRWILVRAEDRALAWSGSRWVVHLRGIPADVQVSNFSSMAEAVIYAHQAGFEIEGIGGEAL